MSIRSPVARRPPRSLLFAALLSALTPLAGCAIATPFRAGALRDAGPPGEAVLVSFTHARLKAGDRSTFDRYVQQVFDGMQGSPGLLASSIRRQLLGREVWTFSVWASKEDLVQFVRSPQHREAIAAASAMLETFETRRRVLPREKLPGNWDEALALFAGEPVPP